VDFAVHSFKDVPTEIPEGLIVAAVPERESPCDAIVSQYPTFEEMPVEAVIGTSSIRRKAQVLHLRSDLNVADLRGNLDTRIRKLKEGQYDAVVVAEAGLRRLGFSEYNPLDPGMFIPAPGQGAIGIMSRKDDKEVLEHLMPLDHSATHSACLCERAFLSRLEGGCQIPAGVLTGIDSDEITISGFISSTDGKIMLKSQEKGPLVRAEELAGALAHTLLESGGRDILDEIRGGGK
jgi:hydroxymethylbilane synthase